LSFPNVIGAQPVRLFAEFVYNWDAVNDDAYGYLGGLRLGQTKVRNDWSIYAFYERLEQEAAISAFTYSDYDPGGTSLRTGEQITTLRRARLASSLRAEWCRSSPLRPLR